MPAGVAGRAFRLSGFQMAGSNVLNLEMAVRAFDLVVGDVCLMQQVAVLVLSEAVRLVMASETALARHPAGVGSRRRMAGDA